LSKLIKFLTKKVGHFDRKK